MRGFAGSIGMLMLISPLQLAAQQAIPGYRLLRFEEDWSSAGTLEGADRLKFLSLDADGSRYLSLGGSLRQRVEGVRGFMAVAGADEDLFSLTRLLLHADLHLGSSFRVFAEGKHAAAVGRELPGGRRPLDHDEADVQNLFVEVAGSVGTGKLSVRVGRQELALGRQRLVSPIDWTNARRTFDGARAEYRTGGTVTELFWTRPVQVRSWGLNRWDAGRSFYGMAVGSANGSWQGYLLDSKEAGVTRFPGLAGEHHRVTVGGRAAAGDATRGVRIDVEGGVQTGRLAGVPVRAWFVATDLSHTTTRVPFDPTLTLGVDWASGDADEADGVAGTFDQLFSLGHAYGGYADVLGRQNLAELRLVVEGGRGPVRARIAGHAFGRASLADAAYTVGGTVLEPSAGREERWIGREIDLTTSVQAGRHIRLEAGYTRFSPGAFLSRRTTGAATHDGLFAGATYTF